LAAGSLRIDLSYAPVCLWQVSAKTALDLKRESLLPFVPLMRGGRGELEAGARLLWEVAEEKHRQELTLHFLLLGGLRYNPVDLLDLIGSESMIPVEQLKESSFYKYILEEGLQKGREEGRLEGEAALLRRMLEQRFGTLPEWAARKIENADRMALEEWSLRFVGADSLEDVIAKSGTD
jgi:predicted transposase YdaD